MFGKKSTTERSQRSSSNPMSQFLLDMPDLDANFGMADDDDISDEDLEAELAMLQGGKMPKRPARKVKQPLDLDSIQRMAQASIDEDDDKDIDENDPELLAELEGIVSDEEEVEPSRTPSLSSSSTIMLLEERIQMYQSAIESAKIAGDTSRARRSGRGLDTLQNMLKTVKAGKPINEEDIPPPIVKTVKPVEERPLPEKRPSIDNLLFDDKPTKSVPAARQNLNNLPQPMLPQRPAPKLPPITIKPPSAAIKPTPLGVVPAFESDDNSATHIMLTTRRDQYKVAAVKAKQVGDQATAIKYLKMVKQFEAVISALDAGQPIDLSKMPPPPPELSVPGSGNIMPTSPQQTIADPKPEFPDPLIEVSEEEAANIMKAPPAPKTVLEALQQRLDKYKSAEEAAKQEENSMKARRMNRIVKQYQDAIKANKAGKPYDYAELPTPPGFAPIPGYSNASSAPVSSPASTSVSAPVPSPVPSSSITPSTQTKSPMAPSIQKPQIKSVPSGPSKPASSQPPKRLVTHIHEQQLTVLMQRHAQFKSAALEAKNNGDLQLAKEYLRSAKGFEPMIEASTNGLPVDMSKIPIPPQQLEQDFVRVEKEDCIPPDGDRGSTYRQLEKDLIEQVNMCTRNSEYFVRLGDVPSANKFSTYAKHSRKDLEALRNAFKHGDPVPKFHYEFRTFSLVQCCAELGDDELEVVIVRGLNYSLPGYKPTDFDTFVKFELPFPNDAPVSDKTSICRGTNNPEYNSPFKLPIKRSSRAFARVVKTKAIKFEVYVKGGLLRSDKLVGQISIKLAPLETICVLHDSFDLLDNRRPCGGKLEVKLRIREPFSAKQVEEVKEKWLIFDEFVRSSSNKFAPSLRIDSKDEPICDDSINTFSLATGMAQIFQAAEVIPSVMLHSDILSTVKNRNEEKEDKENEDEDCKNKENEDEDCKNKENDD